MKVEEVVERVKYIEKIKEDDEDAHSNEDKLYFDVLLAIADGAPNAKELAIAALRASKIEFARWCA